MLVQFKFLMKFDRENSAPANDEILSKGLTGGNMGNLDQHQHEQCCPLLSWQSWSCQTRRTNRIVQEGGPGRRFRLSRLDRCSGSVVLEWHLCRPLAFEINVC